MPVSYGGRPAPTISVFPTNNPSKEGVGIKGMERVYISRGLLGLFVSFPALPTLVFFSTTWTTKSADATGVCADCSLAATKTSRC